MPDLPNLGVHSLPPPREPGSSTVRFRLQGRVFEVPADDPRLSRLPREAEILPSGSQESSWTPPPGAATMGPADPSLMRQREVNVGPRDPYYDPMKEATFHSALGNVGDAALSAKDAIMEEGVPFEVAYRAAMERRRRLAAGFAADHPGGQFVASTTGAMLPMGAGQKVAGGLGMIGAGGLRGALSASPDDPGDTFASADQAARAGAGGATETAVGVGVGKAVGGISRGIGRLLQKGETPPPIPAPPPETGIRMVEHNTGLLDARGNPIVEIREIPFTKHFPAPPQPPPPSIPLGKGMDRFYIKLPGVPVSVRLPAPENLAIPESMGSKMGSAGRAMSRFGTGAELGIPAMAPDTHDELDWAIWRALGGQ